MKTISVALKNHLAGEVLTTAICWKVTLTNNTVYGFTSHSANIVFDSVTYSASTGVTPSAIVSNADLAVDNLEVQGVLDSSVITEADIAAGLWDYAAVEIFLVNWADLSMGSLKLRIGRLGEVRSGRIAYSAEMRGLSQNLQQTIGELYSPNCRANLGDTRCGVSLGPWTQSGTITNVLAQDRFSTNATQEEDYFTGGKITWSAGQNNGLSMEVAQFSRGIFYLALPMPYTIAVGDTFTAIAGCRKQFTRDCVGKFSNGINFRGEPYVPGNDQLAASGTYKWETTNPADVAQT